MRANTSKTQNSSLRKAVVKITDFSKDTKTKKTLEETEYRLKKSVEAASLGIAVWDIGNYITEPNYALLKMLKRRSLKKTGLYTIFCRDDAERFQKAKLSIERDGVFKEFETELINGRGLSIPVLVSGVSFAGDRQSALLFITDISDRKDVERKKSEFISIASHELKTPITSMKVYAELLKKCVDQNSKSYMYAVKLGEQIDRLAELVRELLDISRIETNKFSLHKEQLDLGLLLNKVCKDMEQTFSKHRVYIVEKSSIKVKADPLRITQVLINLLTNAVKYSPKHDTVKVYLKNDDHLAYIGIQDFGIGISKENQQKLFKQFYRVFGESERTYPGLGVGLYISREIVKKHGGDMWVVSKLGHGSTFWFTLPYEKYKSTLY